MPLTLSKSWKSVSGSTGLTRWWSKPVSWVRRRSSFHAPTGERDHHRHQIGTERSHATTDLDAVHPRQPNIAKHHLRPNPLDEARGLLGRRAPRSRRSRGPSSQSSSTSAESSLSSMTTTLRPALWATSGGGRLDSYTTWILAVSAGMASVNTLPWPRPALVAVSVPPCISASLRESAKPRPKPPCETSLAFSALANISKTRGRCSASIPIPESMTSMNVVPASCLTSASHGRLRA